MLSWGCIIEFCTKLELKEGAEGKAGCPWNPVNRSELEEEGIGLECPDNFWKQKTQQ